MYRSCKPNRYFVEEKEWKSSGRLELKNSENASVKVTIMQPRRKGNRTYDIMSFAEYRDWTPKDGVYMDSATETLPLIDDETEEEWLARKKASAERLTKKLNEYRKSIGLEAHDVPECARA